NHRIAPPAGITPVPWRCLSPDGRCRNIPCQTFLGRRAMNMDETQALVAVVYRFFSGLDRRDTQAVGGLMADDGAGNRQGTELVGPDAVRAALAQRDPRRQTAHIVSNLWIEQATPDTARVRFYMTAYETLTSSDGVVGEPR